MSFSPDGGLLATQHRFGITVYDTAEGRIVGKIEERRWSAEGFRWSADGKLLIIATEVKEQGNLEISYLSVREWDRQDGETRLLIQPAAFAASVRDSEERNRT